MLTPILCFTCGMPLGDVAPVYHHIRAKRMVAKYGSVGTRVAPTQAAVDPTQVENLMSDILDALKVSKCCRVRLITAMLFCEYY